MQRLLVVAAAVAAACRLDPLVDDKPGASAHLLPAGTEIPDVVTDLELRDQITVNDGIDSKALIDGKIIPRGTGQASVVTGPGQTSAMAVRFWAFGPATRAPAPLYRFGTRDGAGVFTSGDHLPLVDAVPGDYQYNPVHTVYDVVFTGDYRGQLITTRTALADAIELGIVEAPVATDTFVDSPIVRPGLLLEVGTIPPIDPTKVYARGHTVDTFELGNAFGPLPVSPGFLPAYQVSFLRQQTRSGSYDSRRPIFQVPLPTSNTASYSPVSVVVDVDLVSTTDPSTITQDSDLFRRDATGAIIGTMADVAQFTVTTTTLLLQLQFVEGKP